MDATCGPSYKACLYSEDITAAPTERNDYFRSYGRDLYFEGRNCLMQPLAVIQRGAGSMMQS